MKHSIATSENIAPLQERLRTHPLYDAIKTIEDVQIFMENHVFAVWDFMTILKSLQQKLTCVEMVWLPSRDTLSRRLINEIVLCEESDIDGEGGYASHFEIYLRAMQRCHADTTQIDEFVSSLENGASALVALENARIPDCTRQFVYRTLSTATHSQSCELAAAFAYGREHLLPDVFERVIREVGEIGNERLGYFVTYLRRHIEVDADSHGPMAEQMICNLCGTSDLNWRLAEQAAVRALEARIRLWDGILMQIECHDPEVPHSKGESPSDAKEFFIEAAIQLGWSDGLSTDEISQQLHMSAKQVEAIVASGDDIAG